MSVLTLPSGSRPSNLHLGPGMSHVHIDGDVLNICGQLREIDPNLYVVLLEQDDEGTFAIMESCRDGWERLVMKTTTLDGRVLNRMRWLMAIPLKRRLAILEAEETARAKAAKENELDRLYEDLGRPMWTQLEHDGFIETRGVSFPKRGVTGGRGSLVRS